MKKCKSIALVTLLILALFAVSCGQAAKESLPETAENAGTIEETGTAAAENAAGTETAGTEAEENAEGTEAAAAEAALRAGTAEGTETGEEFPAGDPDEVAAVILHTNDVHVGLQDNIGYDGLSLYRKELEALYDNVLLIDAGDAIQGAALGAMSKGAEIIKIMNELGYDLAIPGNHEFDFGFDVLDDCSEQLACGYICANFCTIDGETVFEPWRILKAGDLKIGFVGAVTPDTFTRSAIKDVVNEVGEPMYDFLADETGDRLAGALQKNIDEVREQGADYVILVAHLGNATENTSIYSSNAIVGKLNGIDMVIDGHSHEVYNTAIPDKDGKMTPIAQTGTKLQHIGQLTVYKDGHLEENIIDLVPESAAVPAESVTRKNEERYVDPETKTFIDNIYGAYDSIMSRKIGDLSVDLIKMENGKDLSRTAENGLCELAADAFRAVGGTQAGLIGAGSLRTNLEAGEVTYQDVVDILPYCNEVIMAEVSGQTLLDALEFGVSFLPENSGGFPQVSGITFSINTEIESSVTMNEKKQFVSVDGEYRVHDVKVDGKDLDPNAIYTLAITQYLLTGGDGFTMFKDAEIIATTGLADNEVVMKYIEEDLNGVIPETYAEPQGRIRK